MRASTFVLGLVLAGPATAATPLTGQAVVIEADRTVDDDVYAAGNEVRVLGRITGDLVAAAGTVEVRGAVDGDVVAGGGTVRIVGPVGGTVRAVGGRIEVIGPVAEDLVAAGGEIALLGDGDVGRDALVAGGEVGLSGRVGRSVDAAAEALTLSGTVGGDVHADVDTLQVGDAARVGGALEVASVAPPVIAPGARIEGGVERTAAAPRQPSGPRAAVAAVVTWIRRLVGLAALGLLLLWLLPRFSDRAATTVREAPGPSAGVGLGLAVGVPAIATLVLFLGLLLGGWWLAFLLLGLYAVVAVLGLDVSALGLGRWLAARAGRAEVGPGWALFLGLVVLLLAGAVPILGAFVLLAGFLLGSGALAISLVRGREEVQEAPA